MSKEMPSDSALDRVSDLDGVFGVTGLAEDPHGTVRDAEGNVFATRSDGDYLLNIPYPRAAVRISGVTTTKEKYN